ncbi:MAG: hypothetical protein GY927_14240 [bacterium]|nr:hypothetical protein [bacterium]
MLIQLNRCSDCYHHWLEITSYLNANELKTKKNQRINWSQIPHALAALSGHWKVAMPAAVAIAGFLVFSPTPSDLDAQINENY